MMPFTPYHPGEDDGTLGTTAGVAIRARLRRINARLDRIETAFRQGAALPGALTPQQVAILALQDELAAQRLCLGIKGDGGGI